VEYREVAEEAMTDGRLSAAVGNAVHAGVLAADAICAAVLGSRSSGDHDLSVAKVQEVPEIGRDAARRLHRLLAKKSRAEYDPEPATLAEARNAVRDARAIVEAAGGVVHPG